jgi:hypothetical protein
LRLQLEEIVKIKCSNNIKILLSQEQLIN